MPELISILGVEVPEPPQVSLAGIKADAVTLHWTRPGVNKPVVKYLIQVNGVNGRPLRQRNSSITLLINIFHSWGIVASGNGNYGHRPQVGALL